MTHPPAYLCAVQCYLTKETPKTMGESVDAKKVVLTELGCLADVTDYATVMGWDPTYAHIDLLAVLLYSALFFFLIFFNSSRCQQDLFGHHRMSSLSV